MAIFKQGMSHEFASVLFEKMSKMIAEILEDASLVCGLSPSSTGVCLTTYPNQDGYDITQNGVVLARISYSMKDNKFTVEATFNETI